MNSHDVAIIIVSASVASVAVAALFYTALDKVSERERGAGYEEGYFNRERANWNHRDAAGRFKTMEAE